MQENEIKPIHPAEIIDEELAARGWTLHDVMLNSGPYDDERHWGITLLTLEFYMGVRTNEILMDEVVAHTFGDAFDIPAAFFFALHNNWRIAALSEAKA